MNHRATMLGTLLRSCVLAFAGVTLALAEPGLSAGKVRIGVMMPFSSDFAEVGTAYITGARAAAEEINRQGGVGGAKIQLLAIDTLPVASDAVEQAKDTLQATAATEQVFALIGTMGSGSAAALEPLLQASGVALIGPATGLIPQNQSWVFPVRRRDVEVIRDMVKLLGTMSANRLAVVHPRTPDAAAQIQLLREAVKGTPVSLVSLLDVGETNIEMASQVQSILAARPDSVLSLGSYQMTEALVRQSRLAGYRGLFLAHSDVGTLRLMASLQELSRGIGVASGLPSPYAVSLLAAREFRTAMERLPESVRHEFDEASFEGYLAVRVFAEGMRRAGASPSRRALRQALLAQPIEFSGLSLDYRSSAEKGMQTPGSLYVVTRDGRVSK